MVYNYGGHPIRYIVYAFTHVLQYLLQFVTFVLALCTRGISVDILNDSSYVKAIVILSFINLSMINILVFVLYSYPNALASITALSIFLAPSIILPLTFFPKVRKVGLRV